MYLTFRHDSFLNYVLCKTKNLSSLWIAWNWLRSLSMARLLAIARHKIAVFFYLMVHATVIRKLTVTLVDTNYMLLFTLLSLSSLNSKSTPFTRLCFTLCKCNMVFLESVFQFNNMFHIIQCFLFLPILMLYCSVLLTLTKTHYALIFFLFLLLFFWCTKYFFYFKNPTFFLKM